MMTAIRCEIFPTCLHPLLRDPVLRKTFPSIPAVSHQAQQPGQPAIHQQAGVILQRASLLAHYPVQILWYKSPDSAQSKNSTKAKDWVKDRSWASHKDGCLKERISFSVCQLF